METAKESIKQYTTKNRHWIDQYDNYYRNTRLNQDPKERITKLLNILRYHGWNMNRKLQCTTIIENIHNKIITNEYLINFWYFVDNLPTLKLRELPYTDNNTRNKLADSFQNIRNILCSWHQSAGTLCFLTKVILMFNWGQTPAFDTRVCEVLGVNNRISDSELVQSLVEIGKWICDFENQYNVKIDEYATGLIRSEFKPNLYPIPLGRSVDMIIFSL